MATIGGAGSDTLGRGNGNTLQIGGSTAFDSDAAGLNAILSGWTNGHYGSPYQHPKRPRLTDGYYHNSKTSTSIRSPLCEAAIGGWQT